MSKKKGKNEKKKTKPRLMTQQFTYEKDEGNK